MITERPFVSCRRCRIPIAPTERYGDLCASCARTKPSARAGAEKHPREARLNRDVQATTAGIGFWPGDPA